MMKTQLMTLGVLSLLVAATACSNHREADEPSGLARTVQFHAGVPASKTAFGEADGDSYPTYWTANDTRVKISLNAGEAAEAVVTPSSDGRTADFETEVDPSSAPAPYRFYAVSPASAAEAMSPSRKAWRVRVPSVQTPVEGSVDEAAQILSAKSSSFETMPSEVMLHFSHATAYGRLNLKNLSLGDAVVSGVELTCSTPLAGEFYYSCEDGTFTPAGESSTLRILTTNTSDVWFACAPVDVSGQTMKISVLTDQGIFTKEVTFPAGRRFASGRIVRFGIDMTDAEAGGDVWSLVTRNDLKVGDEVLILNADETYVLGEQSTNNRAAVSVPSGSIVNHVWKTPSADAQVLTLGAGKSEGTWSFLTGNGYLANISGGKNRLLTVDLLSDNSSFTIEIAADGVAAIKAQAGARNLLRFNPNTGIGNPLFACYSSGQEDVCIFRKGGGGDVADDPLLSESRYGAYLTDDRRIYAEGEDQYSREYNAGVLTFAILHPADNEQLEISGYKRTFVKGDELEVRVAHRRGLTVLKNATYTMRVVGEDGSKVWLGDGTGEGFIIKK